MTQWTSALIKALCVIILPSLAICASAWSVLTRQLQCPPVRKLSSGLSGKPRNTKSDCTVASAKTFENWLGTERELCDTFNNYFSKFMVGHVYRIRHQFAEYLKMKSGPDGHAVIICDFSEDYANKYSRAPQSTHFGASHQQSTLHTGVAYINGKEKVLSFATVSDSYIDMIPLQCGVT